MPFERRYDLPVDDPRIQTAERKAAFIPHLLEGNQAMAAGQYAAAIEHFKKAIQLHPGFYLGYARIGDAYYKMQCYAEAAAVFKRSLELNPSQVDVIYRLAKCYKARNMDIQAEAAFDMAREMDTQGAYAERIRDNVESIKNRAARTLHKAGALSSAARSAAFMARCPLLLVPFALLYLLTVAMTVSLNAALLGNPAAAAPAFSLNDRTSVLYYAILCAVTFLINMPFVASAMVMTRDLYEGKAANFSAAVKYAYTRLPAMAGATLLAVFLLGGAALGALVAAALLALPYLPPQARPYLDWAPLPVAAAFFPLFSYAYQSILMDRNSFDDAITASFRIGAQRYIRTCVLLFICGLPLLALVYYSMSLHFAGQFAAGLLRVPLLCWGVGALTVFYLQATGRKYRGDGATAGAAPRSKRRAPKEPGQKAASHESEPHPDDAASALDMELPMSETEMLDAGYPMPEIPDDLILEEHVDMPEHLRHIDLTAPPGEDVPDSSK